MTILSNTKTVQWILLLLFTPLLVGFIIWLFFYSTFFANVPPIISLRNWYRETSQRITKVNSQEEETLPPTSMQAVERLSTGEYVYEFSGKLDSVNWTTARISLLDQYQEPYVFTLNDEVLSRDESQLVNIEKSKQVPSASIVVRWRDRRSLQQIINEHKKNPLSPINKESFDLYSLSLFLNLNETQ